MAKGLDRALIEEAEELQILITGVIASQVRQGEPSYLVLKQEFQDTDVGETDVKQTVCPVPSLVAREKRCGRELERELPPPRIQSIQRLEEETVQDPWVWTTHGHGLSLGLEGVKDAVDCYMEALSRQSSSRYKIPKYKTGGNWRCFMADFKDIMMLADLRPSHQLAHLKQAVPEEAKCLLYQQEVDSVDHALEIWQSFASQGLVHTDGRNFENLQEAQWEVESPSWTDWRRCPKVFRDIGVTLHRSGQVN